MQCLGIDIGLRKKLDLLKISAYAKINLFLDILEKRDDGFHNIESIMQSIALSDTLIFFPDREIKVTCQDPLVPLNKNNTVYKAIVHLREVYGIKKGVRVEIVKRIPVAAGLAGGSADAAAALIGLNSLWELNLDLNGLKKIGLEVGADVPFCLQGGTKLVKGKGEIVEEITEMPGCFFILAVLPQQISTAEMYQRYDEKEIKSELDLKPIVKALLERNLEKICHSMGNIFEKVIAPIVPEVDIVKKEALEKKALSAQMSGSGPTVFAVVKNKEDGDSLLGVFKNYSNNAMITSNYRRGVEIL